MFRAFVTPLFIIRASACRSFSVVLSLGQDKVGIRIGTKDKNKKPQVRRRKDGEVRGTRPKVRVESVAGRVSTEGKASGTPQESRKMSVEVFDVSHERRTERSREGEDNLVLVQTVKSRNNVICPT